MNSHGKLNTLLDRLLTGLQEYNKLRYQLLVELQFYLENIDQSNNTLTYQEKFAQEQTERRIVFQKEEHEINAWLYEKFKKQIERENELFEYQQRYYDKIKSMQEGDLSSLTIKKLEKELQELDAIKKSHEHYIQMLFDTIKECQQQILILNHRIKEIEKEIKKYEKAILDLDEIISSKNKEIGRNEKRILILNEKIEQLDKKEEGLRQERYNIIERVFLDTIVVSKFNLLMVKSDDIHLMDLIHQVDLIRQGMAIIELNHASIIKELKDVLAKEEEINPTVIEIEINNIIKKLLEKNYKEFLSKEDIIYLIKGLSADTYYKEAVGKFISEIMQSKDLHQRLNENLSSINSVKSEKIESIKERDQVNEEQDKLKAEVSEAVEKRQELIEERTVLKQEEVDLRSDLGQVEKIQSTCEQAVHQEERQQKLSSAQQEVSISAKDSIKELLARKRREKEMKNSAPQSPKSASTSAPAFFSGRRKPAEAENDNEFASKNKEKESPDKDNPANQDQDASHPSSENRSKKLG
ncbi:MAG: hypothetical protein K0S27_1359 [Gammaproteobacteria bacterium]|nr:hypothetical protein [Gammaproteobacteria bacterium]